MDNNPNKVQKSDLRFYENREKQQIEVNTAIKSTTGLNLEGGKQDRPILKSFTPTRQHNSSLLENSLSFANTQEYIFIESLSNNIDKHERKKNIQQIESRIQTLTQKVTKLEKIQSKNASCRRLRRKSAQIQKLHKCPNNQCGKNYGTETALKKHLRTKHRQEYTIKNEDDPEVNQKNLP